MTIKVESGKRYVLASGLVTPPMRLWWPNSGAALRVLFEVEQSTPSIGGLLWTENGKEVEPTRGREAYDIVREAADGERAGTFVEVGPQPGAVVVKTAPPTLGVIGRARVALALALLGCARAVVPPLAGSVLSSMASALRGVIEQRAAGRTGGVIIAGWHSDEAGKALAERQERMCLAMAQDARLLHERLNAGRLSESGRF